MRDHPSRVSRRSPETRIEAASLCDSMHRCFRLATFFHARPLPLSIIAFANYLLLRPVMKIHVALCISACCRRDGISHPRKLILLTYRGWKQSYRELVFFLFVSSKLKLFPLLFAALNMFSFLNYDYELNHWENYDRTISWKSWKRRKRLFLCNAYK